ncbi:hypothetical protein D1007_46047 [Hordeum vulgare]|nr:hypothetical protein D1007_46047 [Hordeum vulgare]
MPASPTQCSPLLHSHGGFASSPASDPPAGYGDASGTTGDAASPTVAPLPLIDSDLPEARREMQRVVLDRFHDRSGWSDIHIEIIRYAIFAESARFMGGDGCMDVELIFWTIQEAESSDPMQALRWVFYRTTNPSRLNIWPSRVDALASFPRECYHGGGGVLPLVAMFEVITPFNPGAASSH